MDKEVILKALSEKISSGELSRAEVLSRLQMQPSAIPVAAHPDETKSHLSITKILYVLGAAIVLIGISIFVSQIWPDIGSFGRICVTLGLGLLFAAIGSALIKQQPDNAIGATFHVLGALLIPGGAIVTLMEIGQQALTPWSLALTFGLIFAFYLLLNFSLKHIVLTLFSIINGTAFAYLLLGALVGGADVGNLYAYFTMCVGASYLLLGYSFSESWNKKLVGVLYFFGSGAILGAAFSLVFDSVVWQLVLFALVFGGLLLSVKLKSTSVLVVSTLFLLAHISFITGKYFADSMGWPISLVLLGFLFIGLGYMSVSINKQYIQKTA